MLVAASDRTDLANGKVALFRLNTANARLTPLGSLTIGSGEAYGFCLWRRKTDGALFAFNVMKDGRIIQARLETSGAAPRADVVRTVKLATQSEGCVADDLAPACSMWPRKTSASGGLGADPASAAAPKMFAPVDGVRLVADAEGIAIAPRGAAAGELVVSSQGDSAYAVYSLEDGAFAGRFRIVPGPGGVDGTSDTDGVEIALGAFGPAFPEGVMIAQDGDNAPDAQDFKLISWADVRRALALP